MRFLLTGFSMLLLASVSLAGNCQGTTQLLQTTPLAVPQGYSFQQQQAAPACAATGTCQLQQQTFLQQQTYAAPVVAAAPVILAAPSYNYAAQSVVIQQRAPVVIRQQPVIVRQQPVVIQQAAVVGGGGVNRQFGLFNAARNGTGTGGNRQFGLINVNK